MPAEHEFQKAAVVFIRRAMPGVAVWSIDCGIFSDRSTKSQNAMIARKRRGILAGYPDVVIILSPLICMELKPEKPHNATSAKLRAWEFLITDAQLSRRDELRRAGHHWFGPVTTLPEIEACLRSLQPSYGYQIRASTQQIAAVPKISNRRELAFNATNEEVPF